MLSDFTEIKPVCCAIHIWNERKDRRAKNSCKLLSQAVRCNCPTKMAPQK